MSVKMKDGAYISAINVTRYDCDKCGPFLTTRWPQNDTEVEDFMRKHAWEKHGGLAPRY